ncbi:LHFPL tetraspan subfamily member 6 protein-like [Anneissia japonica]|uniref:LHFPL tetraspan subfamily member 6 protein-like n=1 Tax=Anneissia japonica TaxID=1529436 RepID=UPI00142560FD|nr:LHFPL tetraspan subfamily member 6 protein-like [Anneissia japonica]XP_033103986.1 LHFPL tetraspan subfamily member 6 protein-like [Anneissia japonica]
MRDYQDKDNMSTGSLTPCGVIWSILSFFGMCLVCVGFYMPYWIRGQMVFHQQNYTVTFGIFRRCNYPSNDEFIEQCGRYLTFYDIPSNSWRVCTITVGVGCGLAMLVSFIALFACCIKDIVSKKIGRLTGLIQFIAALFIAAGCGIYPNGWNHSEVKAACGFTSAEYSLGTCQLEWAYFITIAGCVTIFICSTFSYKAGQTKTGHYSTYAL